MFINSNSAFEIVDVMLTVELALLFNPNKHKNSIVRRTCNKLKHRMSKEVQSILHSWTKSNNAYERYNLFMDKVNL